MFQRSKELRKRQTSEEATLWGALRNRKLANFKFRRQHRLGFFVVDFYCPQTKLIIEIDGENHKSEVEYDNQRTSDLEAKGYKVIRFTNAQVRGTIEKVIETILVTCQQKSSSE